MCGMEVCKLYEKYFPVNRIRPLLLWKLLTITYLNIFSVKQFNIRNYLGDCK